jgi:hypothetical protein
MKSRQPLCGQKEIYYTHIYANIINVLINRGTIIKYNQIKQFGFEIRQRPH